ncbi:MAG: sigma-54 dependent transcriptional regulator [Bacteroidota bacterium]
MANNLHSILLIDDDRDFLREVMEGLGSAFDLRIVTSIETAREKLKEFKDQLDIILLDLVFGTDSTQTVGLEFLKELSKDYPKIPVIVITQFGNEERFKTALLYGATQFLRKESLNFQNWQQAIQTEIAKNEILKTSVRTSPQVVEQEFSQLSKQNNIKATAPSFIGETPTIQRIRQELIALSEEPDISVLILGETGTGKDVAARFLHSHGARKAKPFVAVNIAEINKELVQSALFGHKKGSFTGAIDNMVGAFERAKGGVLFLDEIGELDIDIQPKLLRALENKEITPIGGITRQVDIQIIAATNRDLKVAIDNKSFRADLYHRLNDFVVQLPPLRERGSDLQLLAEYYLSQRGENADVFTPEVWQCFHSYHWPGNIRELVSTIRRLLLKKKISGKSQLDSSYLPRDFFATPPNTFRENINNDATGKIAQLDDLDYEHARRELTAIESALSEGYNKSKIVQKLNYKHLDQLRYRIEKYHQNYKDSPLFQEFPLIRKKYKLHT